MAPKLIARELLNGRYTCDLDGYCFRTPWDIWGRWVAFAVIATIIISLAFLFSRHSNQRRYNHGLPPMYGTGWMSTKYSQPSHQQPSNFSNQNNHNPPAPPYSPPRMSPTAGQFGSETISPRNDDLTGINGGQNEGIELTQPKTSYQPPRTSEILYDPPSGPPPKKAL